MGNRGAGATFALPKKRSLTDLVYEEIERLILDGSLKPGEPVNEKAFSDQNGLSRAPIREACRRLEQAGLVEIIVNRGVFVRRISRRTAEELCDIRLVLAQHAARLAAARMTEEQLADWTALAAKIEAAAKSQNLSDYYRLNQQFHMAMVEFSGNARLLQLYMAIANELSLFRWRALVGDPNLDEALAAHRRLVEAARSRDAERLSREVREHLEATNRRLLEAGLLDEEQPA